MRLQGKKALITGGSGTIGRAIVKIFLKEGADVTVVSFSEEEFERVKGDWDGYMDHVRFFKADVTRLEEMEAAAAFTVQEFGRIDILVVAAGILRHMHLKDMTPEVWQSVIDTNLTGTFNSCKAVYPSMAENHYGRMVLISSLGGRTGRPHAGVNYAASKAGMTGIAMNLAQNLGCDGITVNCVAPGPIESEMMNSQPPEVLKALMAPGAIKRMGTPEEVAWACVYLASDEAGYTTGEVLDVNGGMCY